MVDVADLHRRQAGGLDLDHRDVGALVGADDLRLELALVGQRDQHLVGALDHVGIGHHEAVGRQDEAGADAARLLLLVGLLRPVRARALARGARQRLAEEAAEELLHLLVHLAGPALLPLRALLGGADVDHRRPDLLDQVGEVGQAPRLRKSGLGRQQRHRRGERQGDHQAVGAQFLSNRS